MKFKKTVIETIQYALPETVFTSDEIEAHLAPLYDRLKLPYGRLEHMTGIKERRHWAIETRPSEASILAGKKALDASSIGANKIDLLIHCGVCRDRLEPATAAYVHLGLGLPSSVQIMDVSNACLGFLNGMLVAAGMIESGLIDTALIVSGENGRSLLDNTLSKLLDNDFSRKEIKPFFANFTIGSGAVAAVLSSKDKLASDKTVLALDHAVIETHSQASSLCEGGNSTGVGGLEMQTDSEQLLVAGVACAKAAYAKFVMDSDWQDDHVQHYICHQVGKQHQAKLFETLGISLDKNFSTFEYLGNIGSVSVPITLAKALEEKRIQANENIALLGIGSGLCSLMLGLKA